MAFKDSLNSLPGDLGSFLTSDAAPVALGQAAQAFTAEDPKGWQYNLGGLASALGQSKIASKAANRQASERAQLSKMLTHALSGGMNFTPGGELGATDIKYSAGGADTPDKVVLTGDGLLGDGRKDNLYQSDKNLRGSETAQSTASPTKPAGNVRPAAPPMTQPQGGLTPFSIAQAITGSGGGGGDLYGLNPGQISDISRTDILGQEILNRSAGDIYRNRVNEAQAGYLQQRPGIENLKTLSTNQLGQYKLQLQQQRQAAQNAGDLAKVAKINAEIESMDEKLAISAQQADAQTASAAASGSRAMTDSERLSETKKINLADAERRFYNPIGDKGESSYAAAVELNRNAPGDQKYFYFSKDTPAIFNSEGLLGIDWELDTNARFEMPPGVNMQVVRQQAAKKGISLDKALAILLRNMKEKGLK